MDTHQASIAIFQKSVDYPSHQSCPTVPDMVFEAVQRVIENKGCELVKTRDGMYIVQYSATGPFKETTGSDWLPVYVARVQKWNSGGMKKQELESYVRSKDEEK